MLNLEEDQVPFVRRKTGGGTVYHDLGKILSCRIVKLSFSYFF